MPEKIRSNAFLMNTTGHLVPRLWRHPEDQTRNYCDLDFSTKNARSRDLGLVSNTNTRSAK
ncbi:hypothetical protein DXT91_29300 [Agrobacterium tumefaciens]|uniref:Uncharacterized protein n=3 Tax=Rhizobium/Agrobacterium group TaxID=227290 RepID=A0A2Z2PR81_RHIRH|nr:hypothetical protein [Agrobacterium radiobacter]ASK43867.1 hypothetical protein [Rhizobium rhizogenes]ASK45707.1 hypothetical protein [Agrobacterium tumefaciens]ASK46157.1 hypothetical protein [Agrobacterium rubi]AYD04964.1 hypothetical protein NCHU2750_55960 [Neorhizobium sp. NCHU2750]CUX06457.1 hypothetical protein AGR1B_pTi0106 [Agrobacterium fabacearum S56]